MSGACDEREREGACDGIKRLRHRFLHDRGWKLPPPEPP
jgi:hypothetical protein